MGWMESHQAAPPAPSTSRMDFGDDGCDEKGGERGREGVFPFDSLTDPYGGGEGDQLDTLFGLFFDQDITLTRDLSTETSFDLQPFCQF